MSASQKGDHGITPNNDQLLPSQEIEDMRDAFRERADKRKAAQEARSPPSSPVATVHESDPPVDAGVSSRLGTMSNTDEMLDVVVELDNKADDTSAPVVHPNPTMGPTVPKINIPRTSPPPTPMCVIDC